MRSRIDVQRVKSRIAWVQKRLTFLNATGGASEEQADLRKEATDLCALRRLAKGKEHLRGYAVPLDMEALYAKSNLNRR